MKANEPARAAMALGVAIVLAGAPFHALAQGANAAGIGANSFKPIAYADIQKWNSSGCSFSVYRGKDNLALFDTQDPKKTAVFKIDGKVIFVAAAKSADKASYWSGVVAGTPVRLIKGKRNPNFKNDGGSQGGAGRIEWDGPAGPQSLDVRWEEGC